MSEINQVNCDKLRNSVASGQVKLIEAYTLLQNDELSQALSNGSSSAKTNYQDTLTDLMKAEKEYKAFCKEDSK